MVELINHTSNSTFRKKSSQRVFRSQYYGSLHISCHHTIAYSCHWPDYLSHHCHTAQYLRPYYIDVQTAWSTMLLDMCRRMHDWLSVIRTKYFSRWYSVPSLTCDSDGFNFQCIVIYPFDLMGQYTIAGLEPVDWNSGLNIRGGANFCAYAFSTAYLVFSPLCMCTCMVGRQRSICLNRHVTGRQQQK